jgi:oxygen-independent coproporphyrinogen-3 oxidase
MNWGLYIHVPFCIRKCPYCDFYSVTDLSLQNLYTEALIEEIRMRSCSDAANAVFDSVYLGGGTPSVLGQDAVCRIMDAVRSFFNLTRDAEITIEANPGTIDTPMLDGYRKAGVNRINIGVQSFNDKYLFFLGRIHTAGQAAEAIKCAGKAGFSNIGIDLIYGLPGQNKGFWQKDMDAAVSFSPSHISCYILTYEPATKITKDRDAGMFEELPGHQVSAMFVQASKFLSARGYEHYEISNFAASPGLRSRHNQKYWQNNPYLGLGPSAHSYIEPERFSNTANLDDYIASVSAGLFPTDFTERLSLSQRVIEAVYLGLRQAGGIDKKKFQSRFNLNFDDTFGPVVRRFAESGHIVEDSRIVHLTRQGMLFSDAIVSEISSII